MPIRAASKPRGHSSRKDISSAARLVIEQTDHVASAPADNRHNLRWSVECLADELRYSLEHSVGVTERLEARTV